MHPTAQVTQADTYVPANQKNRKTMQFLAKSETVIKSVYDCVYLFTEIMLMTTNHYLLFLSIFRLAVHKLYTRPIISAKRATFN